MDCLYRRHRPVKEGALVQTLAQCGAHTRCRRADSFDYIERFFNPARRLREWILEPHRHVFVERLWRSIKYEEVYLHAYDSVGEARQSIGRYRAGC